jgi:hypothetical protein
MEDSMSKRIECTLLGRMIGTATGWDDSGEMDFVLYDFIPDPRVNIPPGDLSVEITKGLFSHYNDDGEVVWDQDIITTLKDLS